AKYVAEKARTRTKAGPPDRLWEDVYIFDFEQIARLSTLDGHRPGQGVGDFVTHVLQVRRRHARLNLGVGGIPRLQDHLLARCNLDNRWDIRVPAIVPGVRLLPQPFPTVNLDAFHAMPSCKATSIVLHAGFSDPPSVTSL